MGLLGTCATFATDELHECMMRVLVYLGRTPEVGATYTNVGPHAATLRAYADSNWAETRSTTGYTIQLANATIASTSKRQHCISMSSCEAELIALADLAIELIHIRGVCEFIGLKIDGPVEVSTDNKAAYDLCHRFSSAQNSRHIDRKLFKMRELRGLGLVDVKHVGTADNPADLFTKILSRQPFEKHRATVLNLPASAAVDRSRRSSRLSSAAGAAVVPGARRGRFLVSPAQPPVPRHVSFVADGT